MLFRGGTEWLKCLNFDTFQAQPHSLENQSPLQNVRVFYRVSIASWKLHFKVSVYILLNVCRWLCCCARRRSRKAHTGRDKTACIPVFLQIRPGKADYPVRFFPLPFQCGWRVRGDIFRFVWICYLTLPFQHLGGEAGQRGYMTLLPSLQLPDILFC